jgi:hypothetical protein
MMWARPPSISDLRSGRKGELTPPPPPPRPPFLYSKLWGCNLEPVGKRSTMYLPW